MPCGLLGVHIPWSSCVVAAASEWRALNRPAVGLGAAAAVVDGRCCCWRHSLQPTQMCSLLHPIRHTRMQPLEPTRLTISYQFSTSHRFLPSLTTSPRPLLPCRVYQPGLVTPPNLYLAQLARRRLLTGSGSRLHSQSLDTSGTAPAPAPAGAAAAADGWDVPLGEVGEGHRRPPLLEGLLAEEPQAAPGAEQQQPEPEQQQQQPEHVLDTDLLWQMVEQEPAPAPAMAAAEMPQLR